MTKQQNNSGQTEIIRYRAFKACEFGDDDTQFVWHPYIPVGDYTVLMAAGGTGKTYLACKIAADVSRGEKMPGDERKIRPEPGNVLIISGEDRGEILKKRLIGAGADLSRVYIIDSMASVGLNFDEGIREFRETVRRYSPKLIIIDPWHAFLGSGVNINMVNALRPVLHKLSIIARECEAGMLLISHVNKRTQAENANNAATDSTDFINAARSAMMVIFDETPGRKDCRILVHTKSNYSRLGKSVSYRLNDDYGIEWDGLSEIDRSVLEAAARMRKTPYEYLERSRENSENADRLASSIRKMLGEEDSRNISYQEMTDRFGPDIFSGGQPKRALDRIRGILTFDGVDIITGKGVRYNGKSVNGFCVYKMGSDAEKKLEDEEFTEVGKADKAKKSSGAKRKPRQKKTAKKPEEQTRISA